MKKRRILVVGIVLVVAMIVFTTLSLRPEAQTKKSDDEATVVYRGKISDKEREYSGEFRRLHPSRSGRRISDIIEENERSGKRNENISGFWGEHETIFLPETAKESVNQFFSRLVCNADAVVTGIAKSKSSHMSDDETFIFSTYELLVDEVLKNNAASPIENGDVIEVARSGGVVKLDEQLIKLEDYSFEPLKVRSRYFLFLRYVPKAGGYVPVGSEGDFKVEGDSYKKLTKRLVPHDLENEDGSLDLVGRVKSAINGACK